MEESKNKASEYNQENGGYSFAKKAKNLIKYMAFSSVAVAATPLVARADEFDDFKDGMKDLITGSLGKGVALIALLLGGLIGLAKSSAWPALTGLAIAAIFGLGPFLIDTIFTTFGNIGNTTP